MVRFEDELYGGMNMKRAIISVEGLGREFRNFAFETMVICEEGLIEFELPGGTSRFYAINKIRQLDIGPDWTQE